MVLTLAAIFLRMRECLMSPMARCEIFDADEVAVSHVDTRVCRRRFLLSDDPVSGKNFDYRKVFGAAEDRGAGWCSSEWRQVESSGDSESGGGEAHDGRSRRSTIVARRLRPSELMSSPFSRRAEPSVDNFWRCRSRIIWSCSIGRQDRPPLVSKASFFWHGRTLTVLSQKRSENEDPLPAPWGHHELA